MQRIAPTLSFIGTATIATLAAALMSANAWAQGPIDDSRPAAGARSRDAVKAELVMHRQQITSAGGEWTLQQPTELPTASGFTRAQARADYIAARDAVRALNAEDSGSGYLAQMRPRAAITVAGGAVR